MHFSSRRKLLSLLLVAVLTVTLAAQAGVEQRARDSTRIAHQDSVIAARIQATPSTAIFNWMDQWGKLILTVAAVVVVTTTTYRWFLKRIEKKIVTVIAESFKVEIARGSTSAEAIERIETAHGKLDARLTRHLDSIESDLADVLAFLDVALGIDRRLATAEEKRQQMNELLGRAGERLRNRRREDKDEGKEG